MEFDVYENWRSPDGDKFLTNDVCASCYKPTIAYAIIANELICKSCLYGAMESVNKRIRSTFENINRE